MNIKLFNNVSKTNNFGNDGYMSNSNAKSKESLPYCGDIFFVRLAILIRVGKTGYLGSCARVIVYYSKLFFCQNDPPMRESFWQKKSLLQYTMTLLEGPKDPVLPTLLMLISHIGALFALSH